MLAIGAPTDGPSGFVEVAPQGSWMAHFGLAGHTSFLEPGSTIFGGIQCPAALANGFIISDSLALTLAFLEARLRGGGGGPEQFALAWAAQRLLAHLQLALKGAAAAEY